MEASYRTVMYLKLDTITQYNYFYFTKNWTN